MALNIRTDRVFPGMGVSTRIDTSYQNLGAAVSSGNATTIPSTGTFPYGVTAGRIRVKVYNGAGTSPTLTKLQIKVSDGTNTVVVADVNFGTAVTLSTTSWFDGVFDFIADTAASGSGGGATGQLIATTSAGAGSVTSVSVVPTLGGTSPAATIDCEIVPLI